MEKDTKTIEIVQQAQHSDRKSMDRLAEAVGDRLYRYAFRYTLDEDLSNDIVQECIVTMLEKLGELREAGQLWPWLYKIALNKIRLHHRKQNIRKMVPDSQISAEPENTDREEVVASVVYDEFKDAVFAAMRKLKPEYREVINMRFYDQMAYAEIAEITGRSEFAARKLFFRAKREMKKHLSRNGFGKGSLLMAMVFFGKMTAPSKAAAAQITAASAATAAKVGVAASVAAAAVSKTAIVSMTAAGALAVATTVATTGPQQNEMITGGESRETASAAISAINADAGEQEYWYYYPSQDSDVIMMRIKDVGSQGGQSCCRYLQNAEANYSYDSRENTVTITNARYQHGDLSVWRLPTDPGPMAGFIAKMDGLPVWPQDRYRSHASMLLVTQHHGDEDGRPIQVTRHMNVLGEDYFKYDWPTHVTVADLRDSMHKRGWTYFTISGQIDGEPVQGYGQIPFVYARYHAHRPWMKLKISGEVWVNRDFSGFARPWAGLHAIDTVRRDAAAKQIPFISQPAFAKAASDKPSEDTRHKMQVVLQKKDVQIVYTIDMKNDLIEKIEYAGSSEGLLVFDYLQDVQGAGAKFAEPHGSMKGFSIMDLSGR